ALAIKVDPGALGRGLGATEARRNDVATVAFALHREEAQLLPLVLLHANRRAEDVRVERDRTVEVGRRNVEPDDNVGHLALPYDDPTAPAPRPAPHPACQAARSPATPPR